MEGAEGTWIASPASGGENNTYVIKENGSLTGNGFMNIRYYALGFRPIISLNTNVTYYDNGDGTYLME